MKHNVTHLRIKMRFLADHEGGLERAASELEAIARHLREAKPNLCLRRLPMELHDVPKDGEEPKVIQYIGEMDFHWKGGGVV